MGSGHISNDRKPSANEILEEAQRRIDTRQQKPIPPRQRQAAVDANRAVFWLSQHWLAVFNIAVGLFFGGAILAPVLMHLGLTRIAKLFYAFYDPFCHQYTFRSWFLYGKAFAHPLTEPISILKMSEQTHVIGDASMGYKMALCQRDMAIYGIMLLTGLLFGILRRKQTIRPLPMWLYFVFGIMPMMLDGGIQWMSYFVWTLFPAFLSQPFETIPLLRTLTGGLFGWGVAAVTYPQIDEYFQEIHQNLKMKFEW
jgi:uncharacterized membrane protein